MCGLDEERALAALAPWCMSHRYIYLGRDVALPLSEPLDVQLGRRGSGEQQTMNLKSPILCVSNQHLAQQSFFLAIPFTLHVIVNPR